MTGSCQPRVKGKMFKSVVRPAMLYGMETVAGKAGGKYGGSRAENGEVGAGSDKKGQDKKRVREGDGKDCKVERQTTECEAPLVRTREKEREKATWGRRVLEMAVPGRRRGRPKRRWIDVMRGRYGEGWSYGGRRGGSGKVEEACALWRPRIRKSRKKKKKKKKK